MTEQDSDKYAARDGAYTIAMIEDAESKWDATAKAQQHKTVRFTMAVTLLAPTAVILLGFQLIFFREDKAVGASLVALEFLLLLAVLFLGFTGSDPDPKGWASSRIRAEVLRREKFLLQSRIGPYLGVDKPEGEIQRRLRMIEMEEIDPVKLLPLSDGRGHWRDQLEDLHFEQPSDPDLLPILQYYMKDRVEDQLEYYHDKSHKNHARHLKFERAMKAILGLAWLCSGIHLAGLLFLSPVEKNSWESIFTIFSLACPPITAAVAGVQAFFQPNRLKLAYVSQSESLALFANELSLLEEKLMKDTGDHKPETNSKHWREFKRIALRVEEVMANEQIQWWMLINSWTLST